MNLGQKKKLSKVFFQIKMNKQGLGLNKNVLPDETFSKN